MSQSERNTQFARALLGLRALILDGEFAAGTRLPETALAERLEISRTPLRKAMDRLVDEGLLERLANGGCQVASFSIADIVDAMELRGVIEGTAARLAAERGADPALMNEVKAVLVTLDGATWGSSSVDFDVYVRENARFHHLLARLARSPIIEREADRVVRLPLASPSAFLRGQEFVPDFQASLRRAQRQHRHLYEAIRDREGARAEALAREHARLARENLEHVLQGDPRLAGRVPGLALVAT
ncbi:MAG: GntR family transcriptional regulator [Pseudooceanicola sp.]|nr:GntR family transcriptional regulator [Pseudooceanicola sp.]